MSLIKGLDVIDPAKEKAFNLFIEDFINRLKSMKGFEIAPQDTVDKDENNIKE